MNHILLIKKLFNITLESTLCRVSQNLLSNRRLYVELNNERGRWRLQKNGCHKGVFSPQLFSAYTPMNSQSMMEQGASSMQMTCASPPSSLPSHKERTLLKRHCVNSLSTTETTVFVSILTRRKSPRFIYGTERQRDH